MENLYVVGFTGERCHQTGMYQCEIHQTYLIRLEPGAAFPKCDQDPGSTHDTTWIKTD